MALIGRSGISVLLTGLSPFWGGFRYRKMFQFDFMFESNIHSGTMALEKLDLVKNGNEVCYLAHAFDENGNKSHLWMTEEIAAGCVVILRRYATVMWTASEGLVLWGTNSLKEKT